MQRGIEQLQHWRPIITYLEGKCGFEVNLNIVKDHFELYIGLHNKYYDIGFMNAYWVEYAERTADLSMAARAIVDGKESVITAIIVHKDSVVRSIEDLRGKYLAMTIPDESLGGYVIPFCMLDRARLKLDLLFDQIVYSGNYLSILKGVSFGAVDAGAVSEHVLSSEDNLQYSRQVRIIAISEAT